MHKYKKQIIFGSALLAVLIVLGAGLAARSRGRPAVVDFKTQERQVRRDELAKATGKDGNECLVAVDGTVYKIEDSALWQNGQHATSGGQAYCGADLTEAIGRSPHGRKKLDQLEKVGQLIN